MGRMLRKAGGSDPLETLHRCAECGTTVIGLVESACWCGVEVKGHGFVFECFENPATSVSNPQEILVRERPR